MMLPKIIHTIWIGNNQRPEGSKQWIEMNPTYTHFHWDEFRLKECLNNALTNSFVTKYLDRRDKLYSDKYNGAANILRLLILKEYGGIYFDADCTPLRPLTDDLLDNEFFSVYENEVSSPGMVANGIMGCSPDHPVICSMIDNLKDAPISTQRSWIATGPKYLTSTLNNYDGQYTLYPSYYFLPTHWSGKKLDSKGFEPYCEHGWGTTVNAYEDTYLGSEKVKKEKYKERFRKQEIKPGRLEERPIRVRDK